MQSPVNSAVTPLVILYDTFFARLFMLEPSMRMLFEENMIRQSKFLVGLVNIMVSALRMMVHGEVALSSCGEDPRRCQL